MDPLPRNHEPYNIKTKFLTDTTRFSIVFESFDVCLQRLKWPETTFFAQVWTIGHGQNLWVKSVAKEPITQRQRSLLRRAVWMAGIAIDIFRNTVNPCDVSKGRICILLYKVLFYGNFTQKPGLLVEKTWYSFSNLKECTFLSIVDSLFIRLRLSVFALICNFVRQTEKNHVRHISKESPCQTSAPSNWNSYNLEHKTLDLIWW